MKTLKIQSQEQESKGMSNFIKSNQITTEIGPIRSNSITGK
jgi:hypothetical protein